MNEIPELEATKDGLKNWQEVESWLLLNCIEYHKARVEAFRNGWNDEIKFKIATFFLARSCARLSSEIIKMYESAAWPPIIIPRKDFIKPPLWKRIIYLLKTGDWI